MMDRRIWCKTRKIAELVIDHGAGLTEVINEELSAMRSEGDDECDCQNACISQRSFVG